jgi:hypothetical protein
MVIDMVGLLSLIILGVRSSIDECIIVMAECTIVCEDDAGRSCQLRSLA